MRALFLLSYLFISFSCAAAQITNNPQKSEPTSSDSKAENAQKDEKNTVKVGNFNLFLDGCQISYKGKDKTESFTFSFAEPCQFSLDDKGKIRIVKVKNNFVVAVESSQPQTNNESGKTVTDCDTQIRGVIVGKDFVRLSAQTQKVAMCLPFVWDEKMFVVFASRTEKFFR